MGRSLSLSLSLPFILSTSLSNANLNLWSSTSEPPIFFFYTNFSSIEPLQNVTTNIINTRWKRSRRKKREIRRKIIFHHSRAREREEEAWKLFPDRRTVCYRCTRGRRADGREQRTRIWIRGGRLGRGGGVWRAADNGTREREDRTHIHVGPRGVDFSGFPRELVVTVLAASDRPSARRAWLHRHQPKSISVTRLLDRCHRSTEVSPFA